MIIDIEEGLLDLERCLIDTLGVTPEIFEKDSGKVLRMEIALVYLRHLYHDWINRGTLSEAAIMTEIASSLYKCGQSEPYYKAKAMADLLIRYEAAGDDHDLDDKPEGEAYFRMTEFEEEAFREVEQIAMDIFTLEGPDRIFSMSLPTGAAGHRMITCNLVVNDATALRMAIGSRKTYESTIRSIILGR